MRLGNNVNHANFLNGSDWLKNSFSIWRGLGKDKDAKEHPAPFPVALASRLIECFAADPKGVVLDPFAGSGSTLLAALHADMQAVGIDINPAYRRMFEKRLCMLETGNNRWRYEIQDSRDMDRVVKAESVEIAITSPPYWDILNRRRTADKKVTRSYSSNGHDLGNMDDYGDFLNALTMISQQVERALRPKGYFILNVMDIRKGPSFYPLHQDASLAVQCNGGLILNDIIIWDRQTDYNSMRPLGYPYKFIINKVHEYLLIFRKEGKGNGKKTYKRK